MYHRRVTRMPRSVVLIISSLVLLPPAKTRFMGASPYSLGSEKPWPVGLAFIFFAVAREYTRFFGTPLSTSRTLWRGTPSPSCGGARWCRGGAAAPHGVLWAKNLCLL